MGLLGPRRGSREYSATGGNAKNKKRQVLFNLGKVPVGVGSELFMNLRLAAYTTVPHYTAQPSCVTTAPRRCRGRRASKYPRVELIHAKLGRQTKTKEEKRVRRPVSSCKKSRGRLHKCVTSSIQYDTCPPTPLASPSNCTLVMLPVNCQVGRSATFRDQVALLVCLLVGANAGHRDPS